MCNIALEDADTMLSWRKSCRLALYAFAGCFGLGSLSAQLPVVGMNIVNPGERSVAEQDATILQLKEAGVPVVRFGVTLDEKSLNFVRRVNAAGIRMDLIVSPQYPATAPVRPSQPDTFPGMFGGHPLSSADPDLSRMFFQHLLDRLDADGIVPVAFELGNEINWAAFNPEFPLPGEGRVFSYDDLIHDPEAQRIAKGFDQYVNIAAVLRGVRDRSKANAETPIITAGLSDAGSARAVPGSHEDAVSIPATIQYLRARGVDRFVDGYGVHVYLTQVLPQSRQAELNNVVFKSCGSGAPSQAKPCWLTEWGFKNTDESCPTNDTARMTLVREMMTYLDGTANGKRLVAALYFSWDTDAYARQASPLAVFRCGRLSPSGKVALQQH